MRLFSLLTLLFILTACSCSKEYKTYSKEKFLEMAREGDPDLIIRTPKSISEALVNCSDYTPPCRYGLRVIVKRIEMVVLYFEKTEDAIKAARRAKTYRSRNWVLDEVVGEPILERYVKKYLKAEPEF